MCVGEFPPYPSQGQCQELHHVMHATHSHDFMHFPFRMQLMPSGVLWEGMWMGCPQHSVFDDAIYFVHRFIAISSLRYCPCFCALAHKLLSSMVSEESSLLQLPSRLPKATVSGRTKACTYPGLLLVWFIELHLELSGYYQYPLKK